MLEVRSVGYYPERRPVNVFAGAAPVHITLSTLKAVLDTVLVMGTRNRDRRRSGFDDRRRTGFGSDPSGAMPSSPSAGTSAINALR